MIYACNPENTLAFLVKRIRENPGISHRELLGFDKASHARRRKALLIALTRGLIVQSQRSPWTYQIKEAQAAQPQK